VISAQCMQCGQVINEGWRLCPYCGALLESQPSSEVRISVTGIRNCQSEPDGHLTGKEKA